MRKYLIIFAAVFSLSFAHPYYVSIIQIDHNQETKSLELTIKIFTDDLEQTLQKAGAERLYLGEDKESKTADKLIADYLKDKLEITVDGKKYEMQYLGKEIDLDITWCYFEIKEIAKMSEVDVHCIILTEYAETQSNIINVKYGSAQKSMLFNKYRTENGVKF